MPDPDGISTLEIIRNDDSSQNKDTPAVVLPADKILPVQDARLSEKKA